ncbi:AAA family ATPase [Camelliibacillus cellulosilyticus]
MQNYPFRKTGRLTLEVKGNPIMRVMTNEECYSNKNVTHGKNSLKVLITGMSGTGKSSALEKLAERGHRVIDTDSDRWSHWVHLPDGTTDWVWREEAMTKLLTDHVQGRLYVAGCKSNQGKFYPLFDHVVLLRAPADVILNRIAQRKNNPYGKSPEERAESS